MSVATRNDWLERDRAAPMVLVIGESQPEVEALQSLVAERGFRLFPAREGLDVESGAGRAPPDVVVLDVTERETAAQVEATLKRVRSQWDVPVLCLVPYTGHLTHDATALLSADDYLFKPLRALELWSRIRVLLQKGRSRHGQPLVERRNRARRKEDRTETPVPRADDRCVVDEANKSVILEGRKLNLSPKEYELFCLLLDNSGRILSPREIVERVWPDAERASASDVHQYMHLLRRKVEPELSRPRWIVTVRGFGYKLVIPKPA